MPHSTLVYRQLTRAVALIGLGLFAGMAAARTASAQPNTPPTITQQPIGETAGVGESYAFRVEAAGTAPIAYQWLFNGAALAGATNSRLLLTNLNVSQSGSYSVIVSNSAGRIASANAILAVQIFVPRRLGTGRILQLGSLVGVPVILRANGQENAVSFSLSYNTNAYSNPAFITFYSNATVNLNLTRADAAGLTLILPAGETFRAGYRLVGLMRFDLATGSSNLQGGLTFTTNPIPIAAVSATLDSLQISAGIAPQWVPVTSNALLNLQSGLFEQQLMIGNPSATTMTNLNIAVYGLGADSRSNAMALFNAHTNVLTCPFNDCQVYVECECSCDFYDPFWGYCYDYLYCSASDCSTYTTGTIVATPTVQINQLLPGESRLVTMEHYVTDHLTVPRPKYTTYLADPLVRIPRIVTALEITGTRYTNGVFLVEFMTQLGHSYYVQYANTPDDLANSSTVKTAYPAVTGTGGNVQWIDNGPPKTDSAPTNGARLYRVLQSQ